MFGGHVQPAVLNGLLIAAGFTFVALFAIPPMLHQARKRQPVLPAGVAPSLGELAHPEQHGRHEAPPLVAMAPSDGAPTNWPAGGHRPHGQLYRDPYAGNVAEPHDPWRALYSSLAARGQRLHESDLNQEPDPALDPREPTGETPADPTG